MKGTKKKQSYIKRAGPQSRENKSSIDFRDDTWLLLMVSRTSDYHEFVIQVGKEWAHLAQ
jgi:hypothetical protein